MIRINNPKPKRYIQLVFTVIILLNSLGVSIGKSYTAYAQQDADSLPERYIIFLGGIRSTSAQNEDSDVDRRFEFIQNYLINKLGVNKKRFVYFSYSAADSFPFYCSGWGGDNCSYDQNSYLELIDLSKIPTYTIDDTKQSIAQQAKVLEWLIDQVVKKDPNAKIDLIGFSLGGIVSSYWAANIGKDSSLKDHVHSIIILESPVGGILAAEPFLNCGATDFTCKGWQEVFVYLFGRTVLRELQFEYPGYEVADSIVNEMSRAPLCFPMTSIQSTADYLVNNVSFPIKFDFGITNSAPIGVGSQNWQDHHVRHHKEKLGAELVDVDEAVSYRSLLNVNNNVITDNHGAPLNQEQTAQWIGESIRAPFQNKNCSNLPNIAFTGSSTALLFDISGSMNEQDLTGIIKLEAAKNSGARILDMIQAENSVSQGAEVAILSFSNAALVHSSLSADVGATRSALYSLFANGGTGMPDGLRLAIDQFPGTPNGKPIIIMLSDGLPNIGLESVNLGDENLVRQQVLDLATEAGAKDICIYTVGFGIPYTVGSISGQASIDEDFLKQVAANSGCGAYYNAQNADQLANVYVTLRHQSTGNILLSQTGNISQDQTIDIANVQVPDNQSMILFTLNWPGSQLDAVLTDPSGTTVDSNYPNASFSMADTLASVIIQNPQPGDWKVAAKGVDVPDGITTYNAVLSARPDPNPPTEVPQEAPPATVPTAPGFPVVILILVVAGGGIAVYVMMQTRAKSRSRTSVGVISAQLICISGELAGRAIPLRDSLTIGRGSGSALKLKDRVISRQHVVFRFASGQWFVQDMNSQTGTFVNEAKVQATSLKNGDRIRIGSSIFEFRTMR